MTPGKPLVSAITIFFNAEKFIEEAIESVLAQTYDNWELLLVDDGSTDRSTDIAKKYAKEYPIKVRYLEHEVHQNRGMSATRNLGIRNASGKYIAFLDADDFWLPHKLERQVAIFESYPETGVVYGSTQYWYSWTGSVADLGRDHIPVLGVELDTLFAPPALLTRLYPLGEATAPCPSDLMLRRELIERVGGFEESFTGKYQLHEDQAFLSKVYLTENVFASSECWDRYRMHPDSCMSVVKGEGQYDSTRIYLLNYLHDYLSSQQVKDADVWQAVSKALKYYCRPTGEYEQMIREQKAWIGELEKGKTWLEEQWQASQKVAEERAQIIEKQQAWIAELGENKAWQREQWRALQKAADRRGRITGQDAEYTPALGQVQFGDLRRVKPISQNWGFDRGRPIDRYYIENFLVSCAGDIRGRVLEIGDNTYTLRFGGGRVTISDVLHVVDSNPHATIVGDLTAASHIPSDSFDCIILTQTLQLVYDVRTALKTVHRILKPGGVLLATFPGITQTYDAEWGDHWCWSFTTHSAKRLFGEIFSESNVKIEAFGNVLAAIAFLHGLAVDELTQQELDYHEAGYDVTITLRAAKP